MNKKPHYQLYINGQWCEGHDKQVFNSDNPATGKVWATFAGASAEDVNEAVSSAKKALNSSEWANMSATHRGKLLYRLADLVAEHAPSLAEIETNDSGKLLKETLAQTQYVADYYRYFAGLADKLEGATLPIDKEDMHVYTTREPIGIVAAVVPWNAQMFLTATKLGPALAAGCTVILKASEMAACPMLYFAKLIELAGFPAGVVSVITGDAGNCAIPLTSHPDIDKIAFTGGPQAAQHVIRNSAMNYAVTSMELGGKSPIIVFEDSDIDSAANGLIAGNFGASGQSCVAGSRGFVHRSIYDEVVEKIKQKMQSVVIGDPLNPDTQIGPLCTQEQIKKIKSTLEKALSQGAKIEFGGRQPDGLSEGNYFQPTLVTCTEPHFETLKIEMFGPVMTLVPFDNEDEVIAMANDSDYGLGSGIFTNNLARAHRVSKKIKAGICWINTYRAISPIAPFGGYNHSGYGREAGSESILAYTRTKTTWINTSDRPMENPFVMR